MFTWVFFGHEYESSEKFLRVLVRLPAPITIRVAGMTSQCDLDLKLRTAAWKGHLSAVTCLLADGANPNAGDINNSGPLHMAAKNGHLAVAKTLIQAGADCNAATKVFGLRPLHLAARDYGDADMILLLIGSGADPNIGNDDDFRPLHIAAMKGRVTVAKALIECGASLETETARGDKPLDLAIRCGNREIADMIETLVEIKARRFAEMHARMYTFQRQRLMQRRRKLMACPKLV